MSRSKQLEVGRSQATLDQVKVVEQDWEEAEERLLLEVQALLFVHVGKHEHDGGENLREIVDLSLIAVDAGCIPVARHDVHDQPRHSVHCLERKAKLACVNVLNMATEGQLRGL